MLSLDSALLLTRGNPISLGGFLAHLHPAAGVATSVAGDPDDRDMLIGQLNYNRGERSARISYLLPFDVCTAYSVMSLFDGLAVEAGRMGALNLLAELDETSPAFETLRRAGLSVFGWQRIWKLPFDNDSYTGEASPWQDAQSIDEIPIRSLFQCLVPPLSQGIDPLPNHRTRGMVYRQGGELMGYIEFTAGPRGIYLNPLIHPDVENVDRLLTSLAPRLAPLLLRPVYMAVKFYQAWLEPSLEQLQGEVAPRQALMVKRLAASQRVMALNPTQAVLETRRVEPTAPLVNQVSTEPVDHSDTIT
jgi:hypothetical protein